MRVLPPELSPSTPVPVLPPELSPSTRVPVPRVPRSRTSHHRRCTHNSTKHTASEVCRTEATMPPRTNSHRIMRPSWPTVFQPNTSLSAFLCKGSTPGLGSCSRGLWLGSGDARLDSGNGMGLVHSCRVLSLSQFVHLTDW